MAIAPVTVNEFSEHGQPKGDDNVLLSEIDMVGTIFYRPTETLTQKQWFNLPLETAEQYQNTTFPLTTAEAYDMKVLSVQHNFRFDVTTSYDAALQQPTLMVFEQASKFRFDQDKRSGILVVSIADLLPHTWATTSSAAGVTSYVQISKAYANYELTQIVQLGMAQKIKMFFEPVSGLVFPAYSAAVTPLIPGSNVLPAVAATSTPADRGYYITLRLKSIQQTRKT